MIGLLASLCALGIGMTIGSIGSAPAVRRANRQTSDALEQRHRVMMELLLLKAREG